MKKLLVTACIIFVSGLFISCKKEKESTAGKVDQIISQQLRSELTNLGMEIFDGNTPPNMEGTITLTPNYLFKSNIQGDPPMNTAFVNYSIKVFAQTSTNDIKILGTGYGGATSEKEESNDAAISGSGNNFSIYGRHTITVGANSIIVANVYSGTLDGSQVKNLKKAFVVVDDSKGGNALLKNGAIRIFYDANKISEFIK